LCVDVTCPFVLVAAGRIIVTPEVLRSLGRTQTDNVALRVGGRPRRQLVARRCCSSFSPGVIRPRCVDLASNICDGIARCQKHRRHLIARLLCRAAWAQCACVQARRLSRKRACEPVLRLGSFVWSWSYTLSKRDPSKRRWLNVTGWLQRHAFCRSVKCQL